MYAIARGTGSFSQFASQPPCTRLAAAQLSLTSALQRRRGAHTFHRAWPQRRHASAAAGGGQPGGGRGQPVGRSARCDGGGRGGRRHGVVSSSSAWLRVTGRMLMQCLEVEPSHIAFAPRRCSLTFPCLPCCRREDTERELHLMPSILPPGGVGLDATRTAGGPDSPTKSAYLGCAWPPIERLQIGWQALAPGFHVSVVKQEPGLCSSFSLACSPGCCCRDMSGLTASLVRQALPCHFRITTSGSASRANGMAAVANRV